MLFQSFRQPQASAVPIVADITAVPWRRNVGLARAQLQEGSVAGVAGSLHVLRSVMNASDHRYYTRFR